MSQSHSRSENEIVGARLRMFREGFCKMSRTAFALSIGIGSERLASYESGRAPLRFELFQRMNREHFINPQWLATGEGPVRFSGPLEGTDYARYIAPETPRARFMDVYKSAIAPYLDLEMMRALIDVNQFMGAVEALERLSTQAVVALPESTRAKLRDVINALEMVLEAAENLRTIESNAVQKALPTASTTTAKTIDTLPGEAYDSATEMKNLWQPWKNRLQKVCAPDGAKARCARELQVSRQLVSKWLEKTEPTADFALRLIGWIEKEERAMAGK
jgi:DNA-binding transcriptional regulator YiaG